MKPTSGHGQNKSTETLGPRVPKIARAEFQQSFAVAQLAVKLCELEMSKRQTSLQKENLEPANFLNEAWKLLESAREHALRHQTHAEYLMQHNGSKEAREKVVDRILQTSRVPFQKLCDPKRKNGDSEEIRLKTFSPKGKEETICVHWRVYTTKKGFDDLFLAYWCAISIPAWHWWAVRMYGQKLLDSWKRDSVPPNDFLALAKFRRERDKRAANLKNKQQRKRRLPAVKHRKHRTEL
jgi:hypothetical protein